MKLFFNHIGKFNKLHSTFRHYFSDRQMRTVLIVGVACLLYGILGLTFIGQYLVLNPENAMLEYGLFSVVAVFTILGALIYRYIPWKNTERKELFGSFMTELDILLFFAWGFVVIDISVLEGRNTNYIPLLIVYAICTSLFYLYPAVYVAYYLICIINAFLYFFVSNEVKIDEAIFVNIIIFTGIQTVISLARYTVQRKAFQSECQIRELSGELENQLEALDFEKKRADEANKAKGDFLANMSHEIRTPINAVLGLDTMILRESKESNIRKYAKDIQSSGKSLLSLINDILDFSKIESGKMELVCADYEVTGLVNDIVNMIRPKAMEKELDFLVEVDENIPCRLYGDEVRLKQIIVNLLTNAVKYTHTGSVTLKMSATAGGGDTVQLNVSVKDTGIGIKEEDISKLSEEFVRIEESRNRNIEGTGLGINIVLSLLGLMNSKLMVDSVYGEGTDFYFSVEQPVISAEPMGNINEKLTDSFDDDEYVAAFCIPDSRLLVVDDNAMNRNVFVQLLKGLECKIDEAESGKQCLKLIQEIKYDIIFMDHMMPEMDGIETFKKMREMQGHPNVSTPVIILTANAISGAKEKYIAEGFDDYLTKPIDVDKLEGVIKQLIPKDKQKKSVRKIQELGVDTTVSVDLPYIDGVDWQSAMTKLKNEKLLTDSIKAFSVMALSDAEILKKMYGTLKESQSAKNFDEYRIKVHSMKSNAATLGAYHVAGLAKYLEYAARDNDINTIDSLMPTFEKQWLGLKDAIDAAFEIQRDETKELKPVTNEILFSCLDILTEAMDEMDIDRADAVIEELGQYSYEDECKPLIEALAISVMNMDSDECSEVIGKIKNLR